MKAATTILRRFSTHPTARQRGSGTTFGERRRRRRQCLLGVVGAGSAAAVSYAYIQRSLEPLPNEANLPRAFDLNAIHAYFESRRWEVRWRTWEVSSKIARFSTWGILQYLLGNFESFEGQQEFGRRARELLVSLGPAFVKVGQALSIRPDLLPDKVLKELQRLCDDCPEFPWVIAKGTLSKELGQDPADIFDFLADAEPVPIAAASLGQVYRWKNKQTAQIVAVKVQRPGMNHAVALDIAVLRRVGHAVRWIVRLVSETRIDHVQLVDAWATGTYSELDYIAEAANQEHFRSELARRMPRRVIVPKIDKKLTSRRVLVSEWIEGPRLADCSSEVIQKLVPIGVECFVTQLLDIGVFHSDPHPGNLLVKDGKLVLLDFGLVAEIDRTSMDALALACVHLITGKWNELFDDFIVLDFLPSDANREQILPVLTSVLQQGMLAGGNIKRRAKNFQGISDDLNQIFFDLPFSVPSYFALITRALCALEGLALTGNSEFDIFWSAYPHAIKRARSLLGTRQTMDFLSVAAAQAAHELTAEERYQVWKGSSTSRNAVS
mmetsp:Transcript_76626/g.159422  ORF Transcript_76626/g.159422 Transcript_76626/m.159422 type:complete len:552 (+) Transcript_76626:51-1706(+)